MQTNTDPELGQKPPAKYRRKLTDARREQNRRSQRVWREKRKQRRDEEIKTKVQEELKRLREPDANQCNLEVLVPERSESIEMMPAPFPGPHTDAILTGQNMLPGPAPTLPLYLAVYYYVPADSGSEDLRHTWPVPDDTQYKMYTPPPDFSPHGSLASSLPSSLTSSGHQSPFWHSTPRSLYFDSSSPQIGSSLTRQNLPSPYLNRLQLVGESCFAATLSVAQNLGISLSSYVNDHPSPFTTASNASIHTIPVDLRPTGFQLILPHPCYLDCIPFPHFRNMAIYLSSLKKLDHCSLFLDMMHDGMVCWGRDCANGQYGRSMRDGVAWNKRSWEVKRWFWRKWSWIARMTVESIDAGVEVQQQTEEDFDDEDGMLSGSQWWWSLHDEEEGLNLPQGANSQGAAGSAGVGQEPEREELGSYLSRNRTCNVAVRQTNEAHLLVLWE